MWGTFQEVSLPHERRYVRAYWRWLLGWARAPLPRGSIPSTRATDLRALARAERERYRKLVTESNGGALYDILKGWTRPPETPPPKAA